MSAQVIRAAEAVAPEARAKPAAIRVERLVKAFDARPALRGITFSVTPGATLTIFGPNGAGKTTLLRALATLARPTAGTIEVGGFDVVREAHEVRLRTGYVGHQPYIYEDLTARENLLFFARMYGLRDGAARADALLARMELTAKASERVRTLSRGQAQRLALARGLIHDPETLLLDEPDTGLDEVALALLERLIEERRARGQTTALTTHNLERGLRLASEALTLVGGRAAYSGPADGLSAEAVLALYRKGGAA
ncbi:MAG TPA: heme ABC exporter ATP-binding protein CcmA [Ktedonobacterales bacterium]|nr:heme ABC exporter ATP-binding protein CcmA [Ktedonobacterales bacterium]